MEVTGKKANKGSKGSQSLISTLTHADNVDTKSMKKISDMSARDASKGVVFATSSGKKLKNGGVSPAVVRGGGGGKDVKPYERKRNRVLAGGNSNVEPQGERPIHSFKLFGVTITCYGEVQDDGEQRNEGNGVATSESGADSSSSGRGHAPSM